MRLGVISDTHGYFDPKLMDIFHRVDHILHAGDIDHAEVIEALELIAPVSAVSGNGDYRLRERFPHTRLCEFNGFLILLCHRYMGFTMIQPEISAKIDEKKPDVVVYGHTHDSVAHRSEGILYLNPGYAGRKDYPRRHRSVGILDLGTHTPQARIISLD